MKKKLPLWSLFATGAIALFLAAVITLLFCYRFMFLDNKKEYERQLAELSEQLAPQGDKTAFRDLSEKFEKVYSEFSGNYAGDIDFERLEEDVLHDFAAKTGDPYARYLTKSEYAEYRSASKGSAVGIGISIVKDENGRAFISHVEEKSPAAEAGIARLDEITAVDGISVAEAGYSKAIAQIKGKSGSSVTLTIKKPNGNENNIILIRTAIEYTGVRSGVYEDIGYLRLLTIGSYTVSAFKSAVDALEKEGVRAIVIDLRGTTGGTVTALHQTLDYLLPDKNEKGEEINAFKIVDAHENQKIYSCSDEHALSLPLAVLIDSETEKEGEVFALSLKMNAGARIYGEKSVGNFSVQAVASLKDGSALVYTYAYFILPDGTAPTEGIDPDKSVSSGGVNIYLSKLGEDPVFLSAAEDF